MMEDPLKKHPQEDPEAGPKVPKEGKPEFPLDGATEARKSLLVVGFFAVLFGPLINAIQGWLPSKKANDADAPHPEKNDDEDDAAAEVIQDIRGDSSDDLQQAVGQETRRREKGQISEEAR